MNAAATETLARKIAAEATTSAYENGAEGYAKAAEDAAFFCDDTDALRGMTGFDFLEGVSDADLTRAAGRAVALLTVRA